MPNEPKVDLKVLDDAVLKVLAYKPKKKDKKSRPQPIHGRRSA